MSDCDSISSSDSSDGQPQQEIDWISLESQLIGGTLAALQDHFQQAKDREPNEEGKSNIGNGKVSPVFEDVIPTSNKVYKHREYWDHRFETEEHYDWLLAYVDLRDHIRRTVARTARVVVVGCGNSNLSADMYDDGYTSLLSTDFSEVVINAMRQRHEHERPGLRWERMDMLDLSIEDASVDAVIDKAAMDALMVDEGDVWHPEASVIELADRMCREVARVLRPGGVFLQISFAQPHFRKKYISGEHATCRARECAVQGVDIPSKSIIEERGFGCDCDNNSTAVRENSPVQSRYDWSLESFEVQREGGCFGHFVYVMKKYQMEENEDTWSTGEGSVVFPSSELEM
ncbi:unnamed protein product [Choristocarpus tenellus]